jgi:hypothetical protein
VPYIELDSWFETQLTPQQGETYDQFVQRCVTAITALDPTITEDQAREIADQAWAYYVLQNATEATITIKRDFNTYNDSVYLEGWFGDWQITDIISATAPNISYTSLTKRKAQNHEPGWFKVAKTKEDKQLVFGWANIAMDANGNYPLDWDGDVTDPEELEKAAYTFVLKYRETGTDHVGEAVGKLVESVIFTKEKQQAMGIPEGILPVGWWVGFYVEDKEVFEKVKKGEYQMFSVQGKARRVPTGM